MRLTILGLLVSLGFGQETEPRQKPLSVCEVLERRAELMGRFETLRGDYKTAPVERIISVRGEVKYGGHGPYLIAAPVIRRQTGLSARRGLLPISHRHRMRYDEYLANGWPIASGAVEGACKNLIKDRMERSGMRWTEAMAEAVVKLRAIYLGSDFDRYWLFHIQQEQNRLRADRQIVVPK